MQEGFSSHRTRRGVYEVLSLINMTPPLYTLCGKSDWIPLWSHMDCLYIPNRGIYDIMIALDATGVTS